MSTGHSALSWICYGVRRMVRELRFAHWEAHEQLPRMDGRTGSKSGDSGGSRQQNRHWQASKHPQAPEAPDLAAGLLHQKLQMLNCCTFLRKHPEAGFVVTPVVHRREPERALAAAIGDSGSAAAAETITSRKNSPLAEEVRRVVRESTRLFGGAVASNGSTRDGGGGSAAASDTDYVSCCDDLASTAELDAAMDTDVQYPSFELRMPSLVTSDMVAEREAALAALGKRGMPIIGNYIYTSFC